MLSWLKSLVRRPDGVYTKLGFGDMIDRLSILEIKITRLDGDKRDSARSQFCDLRDSLSRAKVNVLEVPEYGALLRINSELWDVEDQIRELGEQIFSGHSAVGDDSWRFMNLSRKVYTLNDKRSGVKAFLDKQLGTKVREVKSYKGN